jgi:hypothetical protein
MGAAQQLVAVKQRPTGAELSALVDRLRRAEKRQAELELKHAPTVQEWVEAQGVDVRTNDIYWRAHARALVATGKAKARAQEVLERWHAERRKAWARLDKATARLAVAAKELEALRVEVVGLRAALRD